MIARHIPYQLMSYIPSPPAQNPYPSHLTHQHHNIPIPSNNPPKMGKFGGLALKSVSFFIRFLQFCCAAIILGLFSYFLAILHNHGLPISTYLRAVEGISGAGVLYTIFALVLVFCLGGITILGIFAALLDLAFTGAFIYIAWETRHGASSCSGVVNTPLGVGDTADDNRIPDGNGGFTHLPRYVTACRMNTACFAVAVIGAVLFFLSLFLEFALIKHHKKQKAFGPSPGNNYTSGRPKRRFWQRKQKNVHDEEKPDALPMHTTPADVRQSYATESTAVGEPTYAKYGPGAPATAAGGLGTQGSGVVHHGGYQTTTTTHVPHNSNGTF